MGKTKKTEKTASTGERRCSVRLADKCKASAPVEKKKAVAKKAPKAKKAKQAENGGTKAEEPKAEATEAK